MLARTYRLTDKTGVVFIKTCLLVLDWVLDGLLWIERRLLMPVLRPFVRGLAVLVALVWGLRGGSARKATQAGATSTRTAMARRTARAEMAAAVPEDPLRRQNRALSLMTLLLLAVLIAVVV